MSDDGYIYVRVVDQILAGHGPVFNRGERIEAATSPLWVGLLALTKSGLPVASIPWLAVILGLLLSLAGLAMAQAAAWSLSPAGRRRVVLPLGSLVLIALPPFWDFATSGLETGLAFAWLGASFWGFVRLYRSSASRHAPEQPSVAVEDRNAIGLAVLIGLAPLVRPDFAIFGLAFMLLFFVLRPHLSRRDRLQFVACALALPVSYEVFRMGYYGALVPNPAFAKEASAANWPQGWHYLVDLMKPYWLPVPLLLVSGLGVASWVATRSMSHGAESAGVTAVVVTPVAAALAHGVYVTYVGGDFMHARLLLPDLFAVLMPASVIAIDTKPRLVVALTVAGWAVLCATTLRVPYSGVGPSGIADERGYYVEASGSEHPIVPGDFRAFLPAFSALLARAQVPRGALQLQSGEQVALRPGMPDVAVVQGRFMGVASHILGTDFHVVDLLGLSDPIAGRLEVSHRGRPGHEKLLPEAWVVARFADPAAPLPAGFQTPSEVIAARADLSCDDIRRLLETVSAPLTAGRFVRNLAEAFRLHRFRIPPNPGEAHARLC